MAITFKEEGHTYESNDQDQINWISVTSVISKFKEPFDQKAIAKKSSKNKRSKWYHNQREADILELDTIEREGIEVPIIRPLNEEDGIKLAPEQKLYDGLYPEHLVYLKSAKICGQADVVEIINNTINITDYKTNKEIKEKGFTNWEGISKKLYNPVSHLDDCHLNHYSLQLSIYAYIIKKHNPKLKVGKLTVQHVKFKKLGEDKNGYPINEHVDGEPVLEEIKMYDLPYLKDEVISIINWLKDKN